MFSGDLARKSFEASALKEWLGRDPYEFFGKKAANQRTRRRG
jgi:hypothetical protein